MLLITIPTADIPNFESGKPVPVTINGESVQLRLETAGRRKLMCWNDEKRRVFDSTPCDIGTMYVGVPLDDEDIEVISAR